MVWRRKRIWVLEALKTKIDLYVDKISRKEVSMKKKLSK